MMHLAKTVFANVIVPAIPPLRIFSPLFAGAGVHVSPYFWALQQPSPSPPQDILKHCKLRLVFWFVGVTKTLQSENW